MTEDPAARLRTTVRRPTRRNHLSEAHMDLTTAPRPMTAPTKPRRGTAIGRPLPTRWRRLVVMTLSLALLGTGCTATRNNHFGVDLGYGLYVRLYQRPTGQLVLYNDAAPSGPWFCGGNEVCTLRFLRNQIDINWVGSNPITDIDFFFEDVQQADLENALQQVRGTNPQRCLMLHRNSTPGGDHHNWTSSDPGGSCQQGALVQL